MASVVWASPEEDVKVKLPVLQQSLEEVRERNLIFVWTKREVKSNKLNCFDTMLIFFDTLSKFPSKGKSHAITE